MNPHQRFLVHHLPERTPVYSSDRIDEVVRYLWGRDVTAYLVYVYEVPVEPLADLTAFACLLYKTLFDMTWPHDLEIPVG